MVKILAFAGSARQESFNKRLVSQAAQGVKDAGAEVTLIDLADFSLPLFDQDLEEAQGMPESAKAFKQLLIEHDGLLIASPEYNSSFSPLLKNMIDWASRKERQDEPPLAAFKGKVAAIMAASPGALGGLRGLVFLRLLLSNIGVVVLPEQMTLPKAMNAFSADGRLLDQQQYQQATDLARRLVSVTASLRS